MAAFDFPPSPTLGQTANGYTWDGEKWITSASGPVNPKRNYIINGAMMISQENGTTAGLTSGFFPVDQFQFAWAHSGSMACVKYDQTNGGAVTPGGSLSRIRIAITSGLVDTSVGAGDLAYLYQTIEGYRVADLLAGGGSAAKFVTLQFGVRAPAGTYCVSFRNGVIDRSYVAEYVISSGEANLETRKSITLQLDQIGTWAKGNTAGLYVGWCLMAGLTYQQAAGSWQAGSKLASANQFNFAGQTQSFELFDVSLTEGTVAPSFVVPDFASELQACRRYWEKSYDYATVAGTPTLAGCFGSPGLPNGVWLFTPKFLAAKRSAPSVVTYSAMTGAINTVWDSASGGSDKASTIDNMSESSFRVSAAATASTICYGQFVANARLP